MPGIAETAHKFQATFYWHLGDLRATYTFDEDIQHQPEHIAKPLSITEYGSIEWTDYIESQIASFGSTPFFWGSEIMKPFLRSKRARSFCCNLRIGWILRCCAPSA